jgi:phosphoribosyl-ATP pyrophosphohydrolase/phosphoribosyl-AMP cyclohydrolase
MSERLSELRFDEKGLLPAVVQDHASGRVLMIAFTNRESLEKTLSTGEAHFWSRSRGELWRKGATSGNVMRVVEVVADCDADAILLRVDAAGPACHTGEVSCFFERLGAGRPSSEASSLGAVLGELFAVIRDRHEKLPPDSYTARLFSEGLDRILKKVGEEASEVVIAGKNRDPAEIASESADLLYHLLVLWEEAGLSPSDVAAELERRRR